MIINTNIIAMKTAFNVGRHERASAKSMNRLSSGLRINSVADDPANTAMVQKMKNQIKGLNEARRSSLDGNSLIQTAEGALSEVTEMLQRMRELAVEAANDSNTGEDRQKMQQEVDELVEEIDDITKRTTFNGMHLLDGSLSHVGQSRRGGVVERRIVNYIDVAAGNPLGEFQYDIDSFGLPPQVIGRISGADDFPPGVISINGLDITIGAADTPDEILTQIISVAGAVGVIVHAPDYPSDGPLVFTGKHVGSHEKITLSTKGANIWDVLAIIPDTIQGQDASITHMSFHGADDSVGDRFLVNVYGNEIKVQGPDSLDFSFELVTATTLYGVNHYGTGEDIDEFGVAITGSVTNMSLDITDRGALHVQTGPDTDMNLTVHIPTINSQKLRVRGANLTTTEEASEAIEIFEGAISQITDIRGYLGAMENRLSYTASSLETTELNMDLARGRIEDTEMALEMTKLAKENILIQAGISILAQANQRPQQILQLL